MGADQTYLDWWNQEIDRCKNGVNMNIGGTIYHVSGLQYANINKRNFTSKEFCDFEYNEMRKNFADKLELIGETFQIEFKNKWFKNPALLQDVYKLLRVHITWESTGHSELEWVKYNLSTQEAFIITEDEMWKWVKEEKRIWEVNRKKLSELKVINTDLVSLALKYIIR